MVATLQLPERAQQVLARVNEGKDAKQIATELEVSPNAVYQQITKLRQLGHLPPKDAPAGPPPNNLSFSDTLAQFEQTLRKRLETIDREGRELEARLEQLHTERNQVVETLERFSPSTD